MEQIVYEIDAIESPPFVKGDVRGISICSSKRVLELCLLEVRPQSPRPPFSKGEVGVRDEVTLRRSCG